MPEKIRVKAPKGLKCPMEGKPRTYISDDENGIEVPATSHYRRLIKDGSLELVILPAVKLASPKKGGSDEQKK